ncbi:MAG: hypothetical protein HYS21_12815 [Deltaproteobacteria bacterium]|nr:hypothetical protein [Deltaproteobacteria bacterium]
MKPVLCSILAGTLILSIASAGMAVESKKAEKKGIMSKTQDEMVKIAKSAAPAFISDNATIMVPGPDGKLKTVKEGTNGFTCVPDLSMQEVPDPACADKAGTQWLMDVINKAEKPSNDVPGIGYMAKGGWHWEKDGKVIMDPATPGAKRVKEPPHWMIFWPFTSTETMLPTMPGEFKTYIMYDGTPYAHLMIYQNPRELKQGKK